MAAEPLDEDPRDDADPRDSALDGSEYQGSGQVISTRPGLELVPSTPEVVETAVMEPAVPEPALMETEVTELAVLESAIVEPAALEPVVLRSGRHRRPTSRRRAALRGFGAMSVRLSLLGLLVVFVVGATVLGVQFAMP